MELITTLSVKDFPWLKDWSYTLWQDTIITWDYWIGKTSVLKAITYLLAWTDLNWHKIPWLLPTTKVIWRGAIDIARTEEGASMSNLNNFVKWWAKYILAKMIPWYLLWWAFTNKEVVEVLSWIEYNTFWRHSNNWETIQWLEVNIEEWKNLNKVMNKFSEAIIAYNYCVKMLWLKWIEINYIEVIHFAMFVKKFFQFRRDLNRQNEPYVNTIEVFLNANDSYKKSNNQLIKEIESLFIDKKIDDDLFVDLMQKWSEIHQLLWWAFWQPPISINDMEQYLQTNYEKSVKDFLNLTNYKEMLASLKKEYFVRVNDVLSSLWMSISNNHQLVINVLDNKEVKPLLALPRHKRFLYEVSLCSRMQSLSLNREMTWLILIDDYILQDDDDTLDYVLSEALAHQVILTQLDTDQKTLAINID